jgi:threonine-phosphate decarboxylase
MIFGHGDDTYRYGDKVKINFSSNIYQKADLRGLEEYLSQHLDAIRHYPAPVAQELEEMIANKLGVPQGMVMVTSGANEAIYLIAQLYHGWASVIPQPTYHEYEDACKMFGHLISYDRTDNLEILPQDRIYWICNPDNPTGNVILKPLLMRIIKQNSRYLYVLDQSYADYTIQKVIKAKDIVNCYNAIIIRSLSKKYCIPGLRLGYLVASPIIIDRLRQIRQPWTVNTLAIEAGKYLMEHNPKVLPDMHIYLTEAQRLKSELQNIEGLMVMDTFTHYMLVNIDWSTSLELKNWLIEHHGILIRDASNFHGLDDHCFRVAAQMPDENDALIAAIKEYKASR